MQPRIKLKIITDDGILSVLPVILQFRYKCDKDGSIRNPSPDRLHHVLHALSEAIEG